jgi:hypothetical protein
MGGFPLSRTFIKSPLLMLSTLLPTRMAGFPAHLVS